MCLDATNNIKKTKKGGDFYLSHTENTITDSNLLNYVRTIIIVF